jgi:hypothetical protein
MQDISSTSILFVSTVPTKLDKLGHEVQNEGLNDVAGTGAAPNAYSIRGIWCN